MKLRNITETKKEENKWIYLPQDIDTTQITKIRVELYDNDHDIKPLAQKQRYRCQLHMWTTSPHNSTSDYKLYNWMSAFKTFKNNQWKKSNDPHKPWYFDTVEFAKDLNEKNVANDAVMHACLGAKQSHTGGKGGFGVYNMPRYAVHLVYAQGYAPHIKLHIEDFKFDLDLDKNSEFADYKLHYVDQAVDQ